ncbi:MAG: efflux RND transporter permease subunit [Patescibacteria group bacterium]|nr:efflux RND transporter permease subunit [Patescibacteria group bacterium]
MNLSEEKVSKREKEIEKVKKFESSPWVFLIRKNRLTYLIIGFLLLFGVLTIGRLPKELNPEVEIPFAVVATVYPGASPLNVERQVTKEIESQISSLTGIEEINSTSSSGLSVITVEFLTSENIDDSIQKLKVEVDVAKRDLPKDAFDPTVSEISFADEAIFTATLASENYDLAALKLYAENVKKDLEGIPYVSEIKILGGRDRVFKVDIDKEKTIQKDLSANVILGILSANHIDFPAGQIDVGDLSYNVRVEGELNTVEQLRNLPIGHVDEKPIFLEDVARISDSFAEESSRSRFGFGGEDSSTAVTLQLFKKTGGDVTEVAETARFTVEKGRGNSYPENVNVEITLDQSEYITDSINSLLRNGGGTVIIVFLLLFFFLGWKEALIAGLSIPFSFFIAFIVMSVLGESLNFLSLFSLVLALGLLVDSAIVIVEGMYQKIAKLRLSGYQAAIAVVKDRAPALLSGMLTTISVFFPLMFLVGIMGQFLKTIPIVINTTLIAALFVSLTIVPAIGALVLNPSTRKKHLQEASTKEEENERSLFVRICTTLKMKCKSHTRSERLSNKIFQFLARKYRKFIPKVISTPKARLIWIGSSWLLFATSIVIMVTGLVKIESFSEPDSEFFTINIEMPQGTGLEETDQVVKKVEDVVKDESQILNYSSNVGSSSGSSLIGGGVSSKNTAFIYANLKKTEDRKEKSDEIIKRITQQLDSQVTEAKLSFSQEKSGPPSGRDIELSIIGEDLLILDELSTTIKKELEQIPTVVSADTSVNFSPGEIVFVPNRDIVAQKGLSVISIGSELNKGISRDNNNEMSIGKDEIEIDLGYDKNQLSSIEDIKNILFATPSGENIALSELGKVNLQASLSSITRRDEERIVSITADTQGGNAAEISEKLRRKIKTMDLPDGYRTDFGGEEESTIETFRDMFMKMIIGILLILFVLMVQFNSYRQVFVIFTTIPLAMIGVVFGMTISRLTLDFPAFIGIISLMGIVVNNAIILIDQINKELAGGKDLLSSVQRAGYTRLRPILLTSITTIMGLLPLSISEPIWRNMGFSIIFGLSVSSFLTLFVVPATFVSLYHKKYGVK